MTIAEKLQRVKTDIDNAYATGYENGRAEGITEEEAYNNGFEAGKQAEYNDFWDNYQQNGERTDYAYAFANVGWNDDNFIPKYNMSATKVNQMFCYSGITDLKGILERQGVTLDTSKVTSFDQFCFTSSITHLPPLDVSSSTTFSQAFRGSKALVSMRLENIPETANFSLAFTDVKNLTDFSCTGTIGNDFNFAYSSNLTHDSLMNIINCLITTSTTKTLKLHATAKAKLTDAEIAIATEKGWTIA